MPYQIIKENLQNPSQKTLLMDGHDAILEIELLEEVAHLCEILNANATDSKYYIRQLN
jgi:hypothetical protein